MKFLSSYSYVDNDNNGHVRIIADEPFNSTSLPEEMFAFRALNTDAFNSKGNLYIPLQYITEYSFSEDKQTVHLKLPKPYILTRVFYYPSTSRNVNQTVDFEFYENFYYEDSSSFMLSSRVESNGHYAFVLWKEKIENIDNIPSTYKAKILDGEEVVGLFKGTSHSTFYLGSSGTHYSGEIIFAQGLIMRDCEIRDNYLFVCDIDNQRFQELVSYDGSYFRKLMDDDRYSARFASRLTGADL